jgi:hypothetical protein
MAQCRANENRLDRTSSALVAQAPATRPLEPDFGAIWVPNRFLFHGGTRAKSRGPMPVEVFVRIVRSASDVIDLRNSSKKSLHFSRVVSRSNCSSWVTSAYVGHASRCAQ